MSITCTTLPTTTAAASDGGGAAYTVHHLSLHLQDGDASVHATVSERYSRLLRLHHRLQDIADATSVQLPSFPGKRAPSRGLLLHRWLTAVLDVPELLGSADLHDGLGLAEDARRVLVSIGQQRVHDREAQRVVERQRRSRGLVAGQEEQLARAREAWQKRSEPLRVPARFHALGPLDLGRFQLADGVLTSDETGRSVRIQDVAPMAATLKTAFPDPVAVPGGALTIDRATDEMTVRVLDRAHELHVVALGLHLQREWTRRR